MLSSTRSARQQSPQRIARLLVLASCFTAGSLLSTGQSTSTTDIAVDQHRAYAAQSTDGPLAFFTFAYAPDVPNECPQTVYGVALDREQTVVGGQLGPSRLHALRSAPGLKVVAAGFHRYGAEPASIYLLDRSDSEPSTWDVASTVIGSQFYSGIEILPDGETLLLATAGVTEYLHRTGPFRVEKYVRSEISPIPEGPGLRGTHRLGPVRGSLEIPAPAAVIRLHPDGSHAHLLLIELVDYSNRRKPRAMQVRTIETSSLQEVGKPIDLPPWMGWGGEQALPSLVVSPDGSLLAATLGDQPAFAAIDPAARSAVKIELADASEVTDLSFSAGGTTSGLLAANVRISASDAATPPAGGVYASQSRVLIGTLTESAFSQNGAGPWFEGSMEPGFPSAIEWGVSGDYILAGIDVSRLSWIGLQAVPLVMELEVFEHGGRIESRRGILTCPHGAFIADILTGNGYESTPTPSATSTTPATDTPSPTPTSTASLTPSPSATPTITPSPALMPIYLPLAHAGSCDPGQVRVDVALVIDASSTMSAPAAPGSGQSKLDAALHAVGIFLDQLSLDQGDQAAIVSFSNDAWLHTGLTASRGELDTALALVEHGLQTRLDLAVAAGAGALQDVARRNPENVPVLVLLTDGRANPVPVEAALAEAQEAKSAGIIIFTIGLGDDVEQEALRDMASDPAYYFKAPSARELADIYREVAESIPCPD